MGVIVWFVELCGLVVVMVDVWFVLVFGGYGCYFWLLVVQFLLLDVGVDFVFVWFDCVSLLLW